MYPGTCRHQPSASQPTEARPVGHALPGAGGVILTPQLGLSELLLLPPGHPEPLLPHLPRPSANTQARFQWLLASAWVSNPSTGVCFLYVDRETLLNCQPSQAFPGSHPAQDTPGLCSASGPEQYPCATPHLPFHPADLLHSCPSLTLPHHTMLSLQGSIRENELTLFQSPHFCSQGLT